MGEHGQEAELLHRAEPDVAVFGSGSEEDPFVLEPGGDLLLAGYRRGVPPDEGVV